MADSPFLKWQDANGNMVPDICPDDDLPIVNKCLDCSPNPFAIVPDWKTQPQEPYLNEKTCEYQLSVLTKDRTLKISYGNSEDSDVARKWKKKLFEHYLDDWTQNATNNLDSNWLSKEPIEPGEPRPGVIETFLAFKEKGLTEENIQKARENIKFKEYYLAPNPGSYVQLLYSIPFTILEELEDVQLPPEPPPPEPDDIIVKMKVYDMVKNNWKVRKGFAMYNRYYKVYKAIEGAHIIHKDDGRIFNLHMYADFWPWEQNSDLAGCLTELDDWLNGYDLNIPNTGWPRWFTESAQEIEFHVTGRYKLKSIKVWTDRCNERPIYFGKRKIRNLKRRKSWKNPTAVAYFLQMTEIERELSARVERPWLEVLKEYTYPEIEATKPQSLATMPAEGNLGDNIPTCVANALGNEFKQLGQDIFDEVFSIGDAVAYAFHKNLCRYAAGEVSSDLMDLGMGFGIDTRISDDMGEDNSNMWAMAMSQAYETVDPRDQVFAQFCFRMLKIKMGSPIQMMDDMWHNGFERIEFCGLFDLLLDALACLMKGLSIKDALITMLKNALKAMTAEDYGKLFVGLPPEKQDELEKLVKENLENGKTFDSLFNNSAREYTSEDGRVSVEPEDVPLIGKIKFTRPWENKDFVDAQKEAMREGGFGNMVPPAGPGRGSSGLQPKAATRRTLAQQLDVGARAKDELDPTKVMDAYILALLEVYSDNLLSLLDRMNDFPGAQIISSILSTLDCPMPPLFNPGIADFLKSIVFPFCREKTPIAWPRIEDPRIWWPKLMDIWGIIYEILKQILLQLILKIVIMILVRICEIIGKAICKALEVVGTTVASLPDIIAGKKNFFNVIRDAICGPQASDEEMENVVTQLVADLGVGAQALANKDRTLAFVEDIGASATKTELLSAMMGDASQDFLTICDQIIENGYPDYRDALPNTNAISSFFENIGFLMPAEMRNEVKAGLGWLGDEPDEEPINPTLCATPEDLQAFKDLRCQLLEGRATPEDCDYMYEKFRGTLLEDLDDVSRMMQQGFAATVNEMMPPIVSQPGCNDGLIPYESPNQIAIVNNSIGGELKKLQLAYGRDMLGGQFGFFGGGGDSKWGLLNMMLADTLGNPYTVHQDKVEGGGDFVDFYTGWNEDDLEKVAEALGFEDGWFSAGISDIEDQEGAWPYYVGEWLMYQYQYAGGGDASLPTSLGLSSMTRDLKDSMRFQSTNLPQPEKRWSVSFERLGFTGGLFTDQDVDFTDLPQMGYNTKPYADMDASKVRFRKAARKDDPDIKLVFKDNAKGYRFGNNGGNSQWKYQYRVSAFFSDMEEYVNPDVEGKAYRNRPDDNIRIYVSDWLNMTSEGLNYGKMAKTGVNSKKAQCKDGSDDCEEEKIISARRYEFMGVDNGLDSLHDEMEKWSMTDFPSLKTAFTEQVSTPPQVLALFDLCRLNAGGDINKIPTKGAIRGFYDDFMETQFKTVSRKIGENETMWRYGAEPDDLDLRDFDYVCPPGWRQVRGADYGTGGKRYKISGEPLEYWECQVADYDSDGERDGVRGLTNDDCVLGMSRNEWTNRQNGTHPEKTRVFVLSPTQYGGSYTNPPMYAKPMKPKGWQGVINLMYPENSQCDPKALDIVEFSDIKQIMDDTYHRLPEDVRLRGDPDCTVEVPYNRILNRFSKAAIQGLIHSAIRIYGSVHFIKCLPIFTVFAPKFPDNYSNVFAAYIIENMENSLRDAGGNFLSPFKDDEFWLAFLEMSVQTYARRVQDGEIPEDKVPKDVKDAMMRLNDMQERFNYPFKEDLQYAKYIDEAAWYETLKSYREEKNLEAILKTQYDAKLILKELVVEELQILGDRFMTNMSLLDMYPEVEDLGYYYLTEFTQGTSLELAGGKIVERAVGLPSSVTAPGTTTPEFTTHRLPDVDYPAESYVDPEVSDDAEGAQELSDFIAAGNKPIVGWPGPFYTDGGQFVTMQGDSYVGYYHGYTNEETGVDEYYAGEFVDNNNPDKQIRALAENLIVGMEKTFLLDEVDADGKQKFEVSFVPIGDVADYDGGSSTTSGDSASDRPFTLQKYISIDGRKYNMSEGVGHIRSLGAGVISQHYPGNMAIIKDSDGVEIGIEGELGVKYGLEMGVNIGGTHAILARAEISVLDVPVGSFAGIEPSSKLLWCLIDLLHRSQGFKIAVDYGFSMKKVLGVMAVYQDLGMLPSIGEVTVGAGALHGDLFHSPASIPYSMKDGVADGKPGMYADYQLGEITVTVDHWLWGDSEEDVYVIDGATMEHTPGWVSEEDRNGFWASLANLL